MSKSGGLDRPCRLHPPGGEEKVLPEAKTPPMDKDIRFNDVTFSYEGS